jgi:hypothetical protein
MLKKELKDTCNFHKGIREYYQHSFKRIASGTQAYLIDMIIRL